MIFKHCACAKGGNHGYEDITDVDCGDGNKSCVFSPRFSFCFLNKESKNHLNDSKSKILYNHNPKV